MKKVVLIGLLIILLTSTKSIAEEVTQTATENKAVIAIQKQPSNAEQKQKITRNVACIIIQINGKVKDISAKLSD